MSLFISKWLWDVESITWLIYKEIGRACALPCLAFTTHHWGIVLPPSPPGKEMQQGLTALWVGTACTSNGAPPALSLSFPIYIRRRLHQSLYVSDESGTTSIS